MASKTKKVKVKLVAGTYVSEEGAATPKDGGTHGTRGQIYRSSDPAHNTLEITEEQLEKFPGKFKPL